MYIKSDFIDKIISQVDIKSVIEDHLDLQKKGVHYFCSSPFSEDRTPSFCVDIIKQRFVDYANGISGNAVTFLMEHKGYSYTEAIEQLAQKYGIEVEYENPEFAKRKIEQNQKRKDLRPILKATLQHYQEQYKSLDDTHSAKFEVEVHRGYTDAIIKDWQIGYAPGGDFIYDKVHKAEWLKEAREIGLIGDRADKYWNRVTYPIHDKNGLLIGFAGRSLNGDKSAKWINPRESVLYQKDKVWFALDRAKREIVKQNSAWIVEGYNDVIAWHINGIINTIAPCGTAITTKQIAELKKLCSTINFCMDPDLAGTKSMLKYIPVFLKEGFRVNITFLPCDPDDFTRLWADVIQKNNGLVAMLEQPESKMDGFSFLMEHNLPGSDIENYTGAKELCKIISCIEDKALAEIYIAWLQKESRVPKGTLNKWIKEYREQTIVQENDKFHEYILPEEIKIPFKELESTIKRYGLFVGNNKIWIMATSEKDQKYFNAVSNFSVQIIQHMQDEKFPMKLLRIKNIHGLEKIFDIPSEQLNTPMGFDNSVTAHGNFLWTGGKNDFQKLRAYLFDNMGNGRKIDVLGWQPEGFFAWNNAVTLPNAENEVIDENGIFILNETSYYIPSANKIYSSNQFKYEAQKRFRLINSTVSFRAYTAKMIEVHREYAISGILFTIASMFQDIVVNELGNFPLLFMFGPASSGKDQLAECCQSFFGIPQTAINLEGGVSTIKAQVREFAQFSNSMSHLSEYKRGDSKLDGVLKGLWDRRGYKRGNIDSHVGTESIPILSSVIMTGNDYPDVEALITRLIWLEMSKTQFTDEEVAKFEELRSMTKKGITSFSNEIIKHRSTFEANFLKKHRMYKDELNAELEGAQSRIISNLSVLGATYEIFKDILDFSFTFTEMKAHFKASVGQQVRKLNSASVLNKFWDCFLASMRGNPIDRLERYRDFKIEGGRLYFNFTNAYNKIQRQWWTQFHEAMPAKTIMIDKLRTDSSYVEDIKSVRMGSGRESTKTSACCVDISKLVISDEIVNAVEWQMNNSTLFSDSPVTPQILTNPKGSNGENQKKLPI